jgi:ectoine hydroxylase-related dioxygenase (phytanoyl-CoA dioxygenase family)
VDEALVRELRLSIDELDRDGLAILREAFSAAEVGGLLAEILGAMQAQQETETAASGEAIRSSAGTVYAARNVLDWFPAARRIWRTPRLMTLLAAALGDEFGLVRALFFDKPPERSWSLPWHKDLTIAVADNRLPSSCFARPTNKAGVAHVEAPAWLLERMLTLRIHLDAVTAENGPLKALPGSHRQGKATDPAPGEPRTILAAAGDVLAMRPLVSHASGLSTPGTRRHRRILHLEFAGVRQLPDGYAWREFIAGE